MSGDRPRQAGRLHFVGIGGSGMSALAQFHALGGDKVTGSDRLFDRGGIAELRTQFDALGISLYPQDGSGIDLGTRKVVVSGAIEDGNPELARAGDLDIPVEHRADALAAQVAGHRTIAVAGTSGKSTVTAMIFEILTTAGRGPSLITGAALSKLARKGLVGNAFRGKSDFLVVEADESDGTLPKYRPEIGVLLNMGKDHKEVSELRELFARFRSRAKRFVVNADAENLSRLAVGAATFGFSGGETRGEHLDMSPNGSWFTIEDVEFELFLPGRYNAENALAAVAAARAVGVPLQDAAAALRIYGGVSRRFEYIGRARGAEIFDDYAHNPDKVRAVLGAAHLQARRVLAVFQPHGFGPTRFLKNEFIAAFSEALEPGDVLWMPDIYYAGGTTVKDISSEDIIYAVRDAGRDARYVPDRSAIIGEIRNEARTGDLVLVMGARDPSLGDFARAVHAAMLK